MAHSTSVWATQQAVLAPVTIRASTLCFVKRGMLRERVIGSGAPLWAVLAIVGGYDVMATILGTLKKRAAATLRAVHARFLRWTKPATRTLVRGAITDVTMSKAALMAENALLRQQLIVLRRQVKRPVFKPHDRLLLILLARLVRSWQEALLIVRPDTLLRWHRHGYRLLWRARSAAAAKRPQVSPETVALIKRIAAENRLWGAERIRGELLKLGIRLGKRTVQRHMRSERSPQPQRRGQTWATFVHTHAHDIWACDFLPIIDLGFRTLFAFFIIDLGSRRVVHVGVTRHPTDAWVAQQVREATPFGLAPRFLIRDNDGKFGAQFARVATGSRIEVLRTPIRAPRANAVCERFLGSVRRECVDHLLILHENQLRRVLLAYCAYFNTARPHQGIGQAIPQTIGYVGTPAAAAPVVSIPVLGGLHHDYRRAA